jgi:hypothetical protein
MILAAQALICVVYCFARHKSHNGLVLSLLTKTCCFPCKCNVCLKNVFKNYFYFKLFF